MAKTSKKRKKVELVIRIPMGCVEHCDDCLFAPLNRPCKWGKIKFEDYCNDFDFDKMSATIEEIKKPNKLINEDYSVLQKRLVDSLKKNNKKLPKLFENMELEQLCDLITYIEENE